MKPRGRRVLLIGLDAADPELIERWTADGTLPHLGALCRGGLSGRLATSAQYLAGSPWPTFYTCQPPSRHGIYHDYQWRQEEMGFAAPTRDWLPASPFWRHLPADVPVVAYDLPMNLGVEPFNGTELSGWAAHDRLAPPASYPSDLLPAIAHRFGEWHMPPEQYGASPVGELLALRHSLLDGIHHSTSLALWLLERPWRLAIVAFSELHRGGHRLFDRTSIAGPVTEPEGECFDCALRDLYVACDEALGRLVASAPDAIILAFSTHGMMANTSRVDLLYEMLTRVLEGRPDARPRRGLLRRMGEAVPVGWRRAAALHVPAPLRNRIMTQWSTGGIAWDRTVAFTLRADLQGYLRVNLAGRERRGIVPLGGLDSLCDRIAEGLFSFRDSLTAAPLVAAVERIDRLYGEGDRRACLPDLVVRWSEQPAAAQAAVASTGLGCIPWPTPGRVPNGRSGNHRGEGFLAVRGPGVPSGERLSPGADILDLAPTVVRLLGTHAELSLAGRVIPQLAGVQ